MFALEKSVSADGFSLRSNDVRPFPFLPSPILPTPLSVEDAGKRMEELCCGLVGNFSIAPSEHAPSVLASPPLIESCNPVVAAASCQQDPESTLSFFQRSMHQDTKGSKGCGGGS